MSLHNRQFYLVGNPYNKRRFNFDERLTQNRVNKSLKLSKLRRNTFAKLRKLKVKFFFSLLKNRQLSIYSGLQASSHNVRLRVRRPSRARRVNPYLFLSKRPQRNVFKLSTIRCLIVKSQFHRTLVKKKSLTGKPLSTSLKLKTVLKLKSSKLKPSFFF